MWTPNLWTTVSTFVPSGPTSPHPKQSGTQLDKIMHIRDFRWSLCDLGLTLDCTRAGNPAEENIVSMLWHCAMEKGAVMPIKVMQLKKWGIVGEKLK